MELSFFDKFYSILKKHIELFTILGLAIIFYFVFFHNIGTYPLMDVDETRYVAMARDMFNTKDFMTLYLNGEYFFEKPPLYFWHECIAFGLFGKINEFSARFPVSLLGFLLSFIIYFFFRKNIGRKFGVITSLILATSLEFIILAKYAILDIVLTFYICIALISYFETFFCRENNKKYFWWLFYLFSGFAVMAKGIPGIAIPFGIVFFVSIFAKRFKENFKLIYLLPGIGIFLLVVLPWHIIMLKKYDPLFFNEYIIKHHLHRFINSENNEIGRKQPFYYYFLTVLWGFFPWILSLIAVIIDKIKNLKKFVFADYIKNINFENLNNREKIMICALISTVWILLFFSLSSTKLVTYILPVYFPLAIIGGNIWYEYINNNKYEKSINIITMIISYIFVFAGIAAIFSPLYLPQQLYNDILNVKWLVIISLIIFGVGNILFIKNKKYLFVFLLNVLFMTVISAFGTGEFFKIDYKFGQQDLIEFAQYAKKHNYTISAFEMGRKYSLLYYNGKKIDYNTDQDLTIEGVSEDLNKNNNVVIIRNKQMDIIEGKVDFNIIKTGRRYTMIKK
ncbi:glycosyltransferase family 39 protein [bacterium]|nr:glycosyltransferase family 39 protein [bacterium]